MNLVARAGSVREVCQGISVLSRGQRNLSENTGNSGCLTRVARAS